MDRTVNSQAVSTTMKAVEAATVMMMAGDDPGVAFAKVREDVEASGVNPVAATAFVNVVAEVTGAMFAAAANGHQVDTEAVVREAYQAAGFRY